MKIHELKLKVFLLEDIKMEDTQKEIADIIDRSFFVTDDLSFIHNENKYKFYVFSSFYPLEKEKVYKKHSIYTITIRTIDENLSNHFIKHLKNQTTKFMKALIIEHKILPKFKIDKIYSLTPCILKSDDGYWRYNLSIEEFERRLKENLIKKYNSFFNKNINEDFEFYNFLEFKNRKPILSNYKKIRLLGDKITLKISDDKIAQEFAYFALSTGILEMNSRGFGYMNAI